MSAGGKRTAMRLFAVLITITAAAFAGLNHAAAPTPPSTIDGEGIMQTFKLKGLDGAMHRLAEWKGKVIMLNFWASWCAPCQAEIRDFIRLQSEYGGQGLQVVGLGLDEARKLKNVNRTLGINYPVLVADPGSDRKLLAAWGNSTGVVPYTVVIDRTGKPTYIHRGPMDEEIFHEFVIPLLGKKG